MMDSLESEDEREKKRKLDEMSDAIKKSDEKMRPTRRKQTKRWRNLTNKWRITRRSHMKRWTNFCRQLTIREEGDDRYKQINERIANMEKEISDTNGKMCK